MSDGRSVNFIVRVETGTINRAIYQAAILHDPVTDAAADPWHRPAGWNGRLIYTFGGGCNPAFRQGRDTSAAVDKNRVKEWLGMGYAVTSATFNSFKNGCNDALSPETVMMVRENFIEQFGPVNHTIGSGCSGGSLQSLLIAQNYPGLLDGIVIACNRPDIISWFVADVSDSSLLSRAFDNAGLGFTDAQKQAVSGYPNWKEIGASWAYSAQRWLIPNLPPKDMGCDAAVPRALIYDAKTNPRGVRCTFYETMVNIFGRDPRTGFARRPLDNVGVQYGLKAFNDGIISAEQFVRLNEAAGGYDMDGQFIPSRTEGNLEAIRIAYETGQVLDGRGGLPTTPIIIVHNYLEQTNRHSRISPFMTRERMIAANGNADNLVLVTRPDDPSGRDTHSDIPSELIVKMDEWLDNLSARPGKRTPAAVVQAKPVDLVDACYTAGGAKIAERATLTGPSKCNALYPLHGNPRIAAGAPVAGDILKCQLMPVDRRSYRRAFTDDQFRRLRATFPTGVCDYRRRGVEQRPLKATWLRY